MTLSTSHVINDTGHVADHNAMATQVNQNTSDIAANKGLPVGATGATQPTRYVGRWSTVGAPVTGTFAVGDFGFDGANTVQICTVAGSPGTFAASAASLTSPDGSITVGGTTANPTVTGLTASALLLGVTNGVLKQPWGEQAFIGPEMWSTTYFSSDSVGGTVGNTSSLTPSLTGAGTTQHKYTNFRTGYFSADGAVQETYRFDYTITNSAPSGWAYIAIRGVTSAGSTVAGTEIYLWGANDGQTTGFRAAFDYTVPANSGVRYVQIEVGLANNVASGTLTLSNVSFRQVATSRPPLQVAWSTISGPSVTSGQLYVDVPITDPVTGVVSYLRRVFGADGNLQFSPISLTNYASGYTHDIITKPSTTSQTVACTDTTMSGTARALHIGNVGQVMGVVKADTSTELRCNTHGGEWGRDRRTVTDGVLNSTTTITSATANFVAGDVGGNVSGAGIPAGAYIASVTNSTTAVLSSAATATASGVTLGIGSFTQNFVFEMDFGDGTWVALTDGTHKHMCRRFRLTSHTQVTRSDQSTPFANVDNTVTLYDDGTMRFDRTITFLATQQMYQWFYFMHSFDTTVLEQGRLGTGQRVITGFDPRQYLTTPAAPTAGNAATGGTYGALTRTYSVTAISGAGRETLASATVASTTSAGTTNSFTVTLPSTQSGQTAWGIYDTTGLLTIIPVAQTTWVDTTPTYGTRVAPVVSTATVLPGTQQFARLMNSKADWSAVYDSDSTNVVFGTITDRDNALTYPGAVALTAEWDSHSGVLKSYFQLFNAAGMQPTATAANQGSYPQSIPNGTALTTTAYTFLYAPLDRTNWHREIAERGQGMKQFAIVYPAT